MAVEPDRLSNLPDDLLRRILRFEPAREAASTAALSRRWRWVWPAPAPAVNLDTRPYERGDGASSYLGGHRCDIDRAAFFRDAEAALGAHASASGTGIRRLAVHVEADGPYSVKSFMSQYPRDDWHSNYIAGDVLAHPACAAVEVLTVEGALRFLSAATTARRRAAFRKREQSAVADDRVGYYDLSLGSVPCAALRVLRVAGCKNLTPPPPPPPGGGGGGGFPWLEAVRLHRCTVSLCTLQDMIAASPRLAALHLERVYIKWKACRPTPGDDEDNDDDYGYDDRRGDYYNNNYYRNSNNDENRDDGVDRVESLCCPGVTSLVLANCSCKDSLRIEVDAPRVRGFRYRGRIGQFFLLKSPLPDVQRADLHILNNRYSSQDAETCERFWLFVKNFSNTKSLKLKLDFEMGNIAVDEKKRYEELLGDTLFVNLDLLEVDGRYEPGSEDVAVAIGNLLQCCPVLRDLRLKLYNFSRRGYRSDWSVRLYTDTFLDRKSKLDTRKSAEHFAHRRNLEFSLGEGDGDGDDQCLASDLPGLSDKWFDFNCLRGSLRRVSLQFRMDKQSTSFGMQLMKFFFQRATVLEEMYIDDGNRKMCEHMNRKVVHGCNNANASHPCSEYQVSAGISQLFGGNKLNSKEEARRRNCWSSSFKILPLERYEERWT